MRLRYKVAGNTLIQIIGRAVSAALMFGATILIARHFGVEAYGELTKILAFTSIFYLAADFGLNAITVKKLGVKKKSGALKPLQTLFSTRILLGAGLTLLTTALAIVLPYSQISGEGFSLLVKTGIVLFAPTILLQAIIRSTNAYFQYKLRYSQAALAQIIGSVVNILLVTSVILLRLQSVLYIIAVFAVSIAVHAFIAYVLLTKITKFRMVFSFNLLPIIALLKKSLPLGLTLVLNIAFFRLDTFLLAIFRSSAEVGLYGLAYKFFEFPLAIPTFFINSIYPLIAHRSSHITHRALIKKSFLFLLLASIASTILLWFLAPLIVLIKNDFAGSVYLFRLLILWLPLFFLSSLGMWVLIAKNKHWQLAKIYSFGLLVNAVLNLIFIPSYGACAAALTTGITEFVILILLFFQL